MLKNCRRLEGMSRGEGEGGRKVSLVELARQQLSVKLASKKGDESERIVSRKGC